MALEPCPIADTYAELLGTDLAEKKLPVLAEVPISDMDDVPFFLEIAYTGLWEVKGVRTSCRGRASWIDWRCPTNFSLRGRMREAEQNKPVSESSS